MEEFVGLKAKTYSYLKTTLTKTKKCVTKRKLKF